MPAYPSTCDIYRPFDDATPTETGIECRLVPDLVNGQRSLGLTWTHYIEVPPDTDIRDACTRSRDTLTITYVDGDEIRIGTTRYGHRLGRTARQRRPHGLPPRVPVAARSDLAGGVRHASTTFYCPFLVVPRAWQFETR